MYTVSYFINKFEKIPEGKWTVGDFFDQLGNACALGHCAECEGEVLDRILEPLRGRLNKALRMTPKINDGEHPDYQQPTPKQRILAALYDIQKMQQPQYPDITKSLAILPEDKVETDVIKSLTKKEEV